MINHLGLSLIADVMGWDTDADATPEYAWLRLMSNVKYDDYSDFRAGVRFLESLATWLRQFKMEDRAAAYTFVKERMVYISAAEMHRVIEIFVPETVTPYICQVAAAAVGIKPYEVWGNKDGAAMFKRMLRRTLFVGMSDGSRIDILRRANAGFLSQEQFVPMMNIGPEKWDDLSKNLRKDEDDDARFENVYLIDDFTASGTTFIRCIDGKWKGKLKRFNEMICNARNSENFPIAKEFNLHIHHYVSSHQAHEALRERVADAEANWQEKSFKKVFVTEGTKLPAELKLLSPGDARILNLCESYYDHDLYMRLKDHCDEAGQSDMKLGYANCALPLVLEHNTPNNSISLLWAETMGKLGHPMRSLFRRRDRHG